MTTLSITFQDEDKSFIETAVKSGRYLTESEVVADALASFKVYEEIRKQRFASLKAKIQVGIDQADRGEFAEFNLENFLAQRHAEFVANEK